MLVTLESPKLCSIFPLKFENFYLSGAQTATYLQQKKRSSVVKQTGTIIEDYYVLLPKALRNKSLDMANSLALTGQ